MMKFLKGYRAVVSTVLFPFLLLGCQDKEKQEKQSVNSNRPEIMVLLNPDVDEARPAPYLGFSIIRFIDTKTEDEGVTTDVGIGIIDM